jgi:hypothetical protein
MSLEGVIQMDVHEIKVETWEELVSHFNSLDDDWLFRGQGDARWALKTSLERHTPSRLTCSSAEGTLLEEFRRRAHNYLAPHHVPPKDASAAWLALMQHFGAPTRLLDATASPYVATYFAAEDRPSGAEAFAVWAIYRPWCYRVAGEAVLRADPSQEAETRRLLKRAKQNAAENQDPKTFAITQGLVSAGLFGDGWRTKPMAVVVPYRPRQLSERLSIQQGEFLVPLNGDLPFMENLSAMLATHTDTRNWLKKFVVRCNPADHGRILDVLRRMNITRAQLFPGLDGFAQSFRQLLIQEPVSDRTARFKAWAAAERERATTSPRPTQEGDK